MNAKIKVMTTQFYKLTFLTLTFMSYGGIADTYKSLPLYKVTSIQDGDSIKVINRHKQNYTLRLEGIDAPELGQYWSRNSKQALSSALKKNGGVIYVQKTGVDFFKRTLAKL